MEILEEDRIIYKAHQLYAREAKRAMERDGVSFQHPSLDATEVIHARDGKVCVVLRNSDCVLAEYALVGERLKRR